MKVLIDECAPRGLKKLAIDHGQVDETGVVQTDGSENLLGVALTTRGNLRLASAFGPGSMQGGRLTKRSLIFENDHRALVFGVFFRFG